jgi:hypothetical protein
MSAANHAKIRALPRNFKFREEQQLAGAGTDLKGAILLL